MLLLNIDYVPGKEIEPLGLVKGTVVQSKNCREAFDKKGELALPALLFAGNCLQPGEGVAPRPAAYVPLSQPYRSAVRNDLRGSLCVPVHIGETPENCFIPQGLGLL